MSWVANQQQQQKNILCPFHAMEYVSLSLFPLEAFCLTMTSLTESSNPLNHTPLYENEQNERDKLQ